MIVLLHQVLKLPLPVAIVLGITCDILIGYVIANALRGFV